MSGLVPPGRGTIEPAKKGSNPMEGDMSDSSTGYMRYMPRYEGLTIVHGSLSGASEREAR